MHFSHYLDVVNDLIFPSSYLGDFKFSIAVVVLASIDAVNERAEFLSVIEIKDPGCRWYSFNLLSTFAFSFKRCFCCSSDKAGFITFFCEDLSALEKNEFN